MIDPTAADAACNALARDLAIDKSTPPPLPPPATPEERTPPPIDAEFDEPEPTEPGEPGEVLGEELLDETEELPAAEPAEVGDAQPGAGRKRRRRRRRRRKGGQPADAVPVESALAEDDAASVVDEGPEIEPAAESDDYDAIEDAETEPTPLAAEEDTASEALRELIATWNVPSWDDIVSGLYRPER